MAKHKKPVPLCKVNFQTLLGRYRIFGRIKDWWGIAMLYG